MRTTRTLFRFLLALPILAGSALAQCEIDAVFGGLPSAEYGEGAVALDVGDGIAVVGAPGFLGNPDDYPGFADVYRIQGSELVFEQRLEPSDGAIGDIFGISAAYSQGRIFVGAPYHGDPVFRTGAVYVFEHDGVAWVETAKLQMDVSLGRQLGWDVDVDGDTLVASGSVYYGVINGNNAAYVFEFDGSSWQQTAKFDEGSGPHGNQMGYSVAISGDTILASDPRDDDLGSNTGAVYVYRRDALGWSLEEKLVVPGSGPCEDSDTCPEIGLDLDLDGDHAVVVGDNLVDHDDLHFFERTPAGWELTASFPEGLGTGGQHRLFISGDRATLLFPSQPQRIVTFARTPSGWMSTGSVPDGLGSLFALRRQVLDDGYLLTSSPYPGSAGASALVQLAPVASTFCTSLPNSSGATALLSAGGCSSITAGELRLRATPVPDQPGLFFFGTAPVQQPFGNGIQCVAGSIVRMAPTMGAGGVLQSELDLSSQGLVPGETRWFQAWFRDPAAGGAGFNLSDGLRVTAGM